MSTRKRKQPTGVQLELVPKTWGGRRPGAGRPKEKDSGVSHLARPALASRFPVHVTTTVLPHVWNLRTKRCFTAIHRSMVEAREQHKVRGGFGFRIIHYSIQGNHMHFVVEAKDAQTLARGVQGLKVRLARALNRVMERKGKVFVDRYHSRILKTPTETHRALMYVLKNARRHAKKHGRTYPRGWADPYSSAVFFDGFRGTRVERCSVFPRERDVAEPRTWLLKDGWRKGGRADPDSTPGRFG